MDLKALKKLREHLHLAAIEAGEVAEAHPMIADEVNKSWNKGGSGYKASRLVEREYNKVLDKLYKEEMARKKAQRT